jgi:hypothetical protein
LTPSASDQAVMGRGAVGILLTTRRNRRS